MEDVRDEWRHDDALGWLPHTPGVDDALLVETEAIPYVPAVPLASPNAIGIDVSHWQTSVSWAQVVASGRSYAYIKATESTNYVSPALDAQYQGATASGALCGLYHFADVAQSPEANADAFSAQVNRLGAVPGHLPPCLDLETGTGDLSGWAQRFVARLRANTGCVRVVVYSSTSFFRNQITENWMDGNIALWIAHPGQPPGQPGYLTPRVAIHQYSTGQVSGVSGAVDLDYMIWPMSTLVPSEASPVTTPPAASTASGLNADQAAQLLAAYQQLSGSAVLGQWPGWPSWPSGSGRSLTLVDYLRQADVQLCAIKAEMDTLKAQGGIAPTSLSDADVARIAAAVAGMLAARLQA